MHITLTIINPHTTKSLPPTLTQDLMYFTSGDIYDWVMEARATLPANATIGIAVAQDTTSKPFSTYRGRLDEALAWVRTLPDWDEYSWKEGRG